MTSIPDVRVGFKTIPLRDNAFDCPGFIAWLSQNGAEIGIPGNPYEVIRYRCLNASGKTQAHIVYRKDSGVLTWTADSMQHYTRFLHGEGMPNPVKDADGVFLKTFPTEQAKRLGTSFQVREKLLKRDGNLCWFCGQPMGYDMTIEHLVPKSNGGRNMLANYALAHRKCNSGAADMPLVQKIELRQRMRGR